MVIMYSLSLRYISLILMFGTVNVVTANFFLNYSISSLVLTKLFVFVTSTSAEGLPFFF